MCWTIFNDHVYLIVTYDILNRNLKRSFGILILQLAIKYAFFSKLNIDWSISLFYTFNNCNFKKINVVFFVLYI